MKCYGCSLKGLLFNTHHRRHKQPSCWTYLFNKIWNPGLSDKRKLQNLRSSKELSCGRNNPFDPSRNLSFRQIKRLSSHRSWLNKKPLLFQMHLTLQLGIFGHDRDLSLEILFNGSESEVWWSDEGGRWKGLTCEIMPHTFCVESPPRPLIFKHLDPIRFLKKCIISCYVDWIKYHYFL